MEDKARFIYKARKYALISLLLSVFLQIPFPVFKYVTVASSAVIYICILLVHRIETGKTDIILTILCSLSLVWVFLKGFNPSPYVNIFGLVIVYSFLIRSFKSITGKWNWFVIGYGTLVVVVSFLNIHIDHKALDIAIILLQFVIIFKFLDPILERIGQEKRRKRLAAEAELRRQNEEAEAEEAKEVPSLEEDDSGMEDIVERTEFFECEKEDKGTEADNNISSENQEK